MAGRPSKKPQAIQDIEDAGVAMNNRVRHDEFQGKWVPHRSVHYKPGPGDEAMNKHLNAPPHFVFPDPGAGARADLAAEAHKRAVAAGITGNQDDRIREEMKTNPLMNPAISWGNSGQSEGRPMGSRRNKAGKIAHLISEHFLNADQNAPGAMGVAAARMGAPVSGSMSQINDTHAAHHPEGLDVGHTHGTRSGWLGRSSGWGKSSPTSATVNSVGTSRQVANHPANAYRNSELERRNKLGVAAARMGGPVSGGLAEPTEQSIVDARGRIGY